MRTITLDILNDKAIDLLKDLEELKIIRIQSNVEDPFTYSANFAAKYSGSMTKQPIEEVEKQLNDLRNEWD